MINPIINSNNNIKSKKNYSDQFKDKERDQLLSPKTKVKNWLVGTSQPTSPSLENHNLSSIKTNNTKRLFKKSKINNNISKLPNINKSNNRLETARQEEKDVSIWLFIKLFFSLFILIISLN